MTPALFPHQMVLRLRCLVNFSLPAEVEVAVSKQGR